MNDTDVRMVRTKITGGLNLVYNLYLSFSIQISQKIVALPLTLPVEHVQALTSLGQSTQ